MAKQLSRVRNWCSELVSIVRVNGNGGLESVPGNLEEIDEYTAVVLSERPVPFASPVHVACSTHILRGVSRTCEFVPELGYFIKIDLAPSSRWSLQWFSPQHLMRLGEYSVGLSA